MKLVDEEFEGWRITVSDDGAVIFFSNRPAVEAAKSEGRSDPELKHVGIPRPVLGRAKELTDST